MGHLDNREELYIYKGKKQISREVDRLAYTLTD